MKTITINDEDELDEFLEPYKTGDDFYNCHFPCDHNCDCEPHGSFSWWDSQFIEFPCEITVLEN